MTCDHDPWYAHPALLVVAVGGAMLEAAVLVLLAREDALGLAPHLTAPPPYGVFHDLRWVLAFHPGWLAFAGEVVAMLTFRGLLTATLVRAAWPRRDDVPTWGVAFRRGVAFSVIASVVLLPWAGLLFGLAIAPVSWLWFAAIAPLILFSLLFHRGAIAGHRWELPSVRTALWVLLTFFVLSAGGAAIELSPWPVALIGAGLTGLWNAWAWQGVVHAVVCSERTRPRLPLVPVAGLVLFAVLFTSASIAFDAVLGGRGGTPRAVAEEDGRPVLVASGFGTDFDGTNDDVLPEFDDRRFSYTGLGPDGEPLPYEADDTYQSLPVLARRMGEQVDAMHARSGEPVHIVAESEGSLIAQLYVVGAVDPPVGTVVLLSPLIRPAQVTYPPRGQDGWGVAGGWVLRGVTQLIAAVSPYEATADAPFIRSIVDHGPLLRRYMTCNARGAEEISLVSLDDAVGQPMDVDTDVPTQVVAAFHASFLSGDPGVVTALLRGEDPPTSPVSSPVHSAVRAFAQAWQFPEVPLSLAWGEDPDGCDAVERGLEDLLELR